MTNEEEIVIRAKDFEMGPDVELYIRKMKTDGTLEKLSQERNLNTNTLKNTSLGKMCDIFPETVGRRLESGDVIIFGNFGTFEMFTGGVG